MKRNIYIAFAIALAVSSLFSSGQFSQATAREPKVLEFDTMVGIPQAFTGVQAPIRGINGGGLPWTVSSASGELKANGELEVSVQGLVLATGINAGSNPISTFRAAVSCLQSDGSTMNVFTDPYPATTGPATSGGGNAEIEAQLSLPQPCIAPIIFVTSPGRSWFASTGY